jgi:hypothetical protein
MAKRLQQFDVPDGEQTVRIAFPDGRTFRLGVRDQNRIRFAVETDDDVQMIEFYGRGGNAIVGLKIVPRSVDQDDEET